MNRLDHGSCLDLLPQLSAGCARLVFGDPPFNIGYEYDEYDDRQDREQYVRWIGRWLSACVRLLTPDGALWVAIGDEYAADYKLRLDALGLTMRNWCVWNYTFGPHQKKKFGRDKTHLLYYTAHPDRLVFNADAIRVESQRQRDGDPRADPRGRVPGDVWHEFPRVTGNSKERTEHPCQMPEGVLERVIRACSDPGDLVVDPFAGSGTTLAVAKRLGRRWYGCELSAAYAAAARERIESVLEAVS